MLKPKYFHKDRSHNAAYFRAFMRYTEFMILNTVSQHLFKVSNYYFSNNKTCKISHFIPLLSTGSFSTSFRLSSKVITSGFASDSNEAFGFFVEGGFGRSSSSSEPTSAGISSSKLSACNKIYHLQLYMFQKT